MGLKFTSKDSNEVSHQWNLTFSHGSGLVSIPNDGGHYSEAMRNYTQVILVETLKSGKEVEYWAVAIHNPNEPFNKETARVYAILKVLENVGLTLHGERVD